MSSKHSGRHQKPVKTATIRVPHGTRIYKHVGPLTGKAETMYGTLTTYAVVAPKEMYLFLLNGHWYSVAGKDVEQIKR